MFFMKDGYFKESKYKTYVSYFTLLLYPILHFYCILNNSMCVYE